jgi:hypothetical protein
MLDSENIVDSKTVVDNKNIVGSESWRAQGQGVDVVFDDFGVQCFISVSVSEDAIQVDEVAVEKLPTDCCGWWSLSPEARRP